MAIKEKKKAGMLEVLLVSFGHFVHDLFTSFLATMLAVLKTTLNLSYTQTSILPVTLRATSLLNPLIGTLADHIGLRYFFILSPAMTAIAMSLIGISSSYFVIIALLIVAGISNSCFHVATPVILKRISQDRVGLSMSFFQIGGEAARTFGPLIIVPVITYWTLKGTIKLIPLGIITSIILYFVFKNIPLEASVKNKEDREKHPIIFTLKNNLFFFFVLFSIMATKTLTASVVSNFLPLYLKDSGKTLWIAGGALTLIQLFATIGVFITGYLSDKISRKKILTILITLTPFTIIGLLFSKGTLFVIMLAVTGLIAFSSTPVILSLIQNYGFKYPSIANGIYMASNFFLSSGILLGVGYFSDIYGMGKVMKFCAYLSFIGIIPVFFLPLHKDEKKAND